MEKEVITAAADDHYEWTCICGNRPIDQGFHSCDEMGVIIEPLRGVWTGIYVCDRCGRIINGDTLEVVGHRAPAA